MGLPEAVKIARAELDPKMRKAFTRHDSRRKKSLMAAYIAWLLLAWHDLYLGKVRVPFASWFTAGGFFL